MNLFIPTRGRASNQRTFMGLTDSLKKDTFLVVDENEYDAHKDLLFENVIPIPKKVKGIAYIRQFIMEYAEQCGIKHLCMLDDDLIFQFRNGSNKIVNATDSQINSSFLFLEKQLKKGFAHCGLSIRSLDFDNTKPIKCTTRMMHTLAYDVSKVLNSGCSFTKDVPRYFSMDDFHMTLQLLEAGHDNIVSLRYKISPSASNSKGGASEWRTLESHNKSANLLKKNHPNFVTVKEKHGWQGMYGTRLDVIVGWKKAYKSSGGK